MNKERACELIDHMFMKWIYPVQASPGKREPEDG